MVPVGTQRAVGFDVSSAALFSRSLTVSSSPQTSSPQSAENMACRISGVGSVKVSERSSTAAEEIEACSMARELMMRDEVEVQVEEEEERLSLFLSRRGFPRTVGIS